MVVLQAVVVIAIESVIAAVFLKYFQVLGGSSQNGKQRGIPVYLTIFILAQLFQILLSWDAVLYFIVNAYICG
jgi:hypothetical protein